MHTIPTTEEATARTLLNMHLVSLYRAGKVLALADTAKASQFLLGLPTHDPRISRLLQETPLALELLRTFLQESLQALCQAESRQLVPMLVPVPPNLELTMGYTGHLQAMFTSVLRNARYLAFYWSASHVYWEDGLGGQTDSWSGYLTWLHHWMVGGSLGPYRDTLGSDDGEMASHAWLLDRTTRLIYIAPRTAAQHVVRSQWPKEAFPNLNVEEATALFKESCQHRLVALPTNEQIWQRYQQELRAVSELKAWLDTYWPMHA